MPTFKEQLEDLQKLKRRLAIWEAVHYLVDEKFVSKDGRKVSGIKVPDSGELIPEEEIEDVLQNIGEGPIAELRAEIAAIETKEVVVLDNKEKASA
jgi:hypothetical protein